MYSSDEDERAVLMAGSAPQKWTEVVRPVASSPPKTLVQMINESVQLAEEALKKAEIEVKHTTYEMQKAECRLSEAKIELVRAKKFFDAYNGIIAEETDK